MEKYLSESGGCSSGFPTASVGCAQADRATVFLTSRLRIFRFFLAEGCTRCVETLFFFLERNNHGKVPSNYVTAGISKLYSNTAHLRIVSHLIPRYQRKNVWFRLYSLRDYI